MTETNEKQCDIPKNTNPIDRAIITTVKAYPDSSKSQISKNVVGLGTTKHIESVYRRLKKSDYLRAEIQTVRDNNRQMLDRIIVPDALKVMKKAIKSKDLDEKGKFSYVKLAMDKSFGDIHHVDRPTQVNIGHIERIQVAIGHDLVPDETQSVSSNDKVNT